MKKTMKTLLALMAGTMALAACSDGVIEAENTPQQPEQTEVARKRITLTAVQEDNGTRAAISSANSKQIVWSAGDKITVLYRDANTTYGFDNVDFSLTNGENTASGTFDGEVLETVTDETVYTALYPRYAKNEVSRPMGIEDLTEDEQSYYTDAKLEAEGMGESIWGILESYFNWGDITQEQYDHIIAFLRGDLISANYSITLTDDGKVTDADFPATQTATEGSFDPAAGLMMAQAVGETSALQFKNVASYFKFTAPFDCMSVSIIDNAHAGKMAGTLTLNYNEGEPTATVTANGTSVITLTGTIEEDKTYYIATLPQTFTEGITMVFAKTDGTEYVKRTSSSYTLGRNKVSYMGTPDLKDENVINPPYVTFSAASTQTLTMSKAVDGLEYSVGGAAWSTLGTSTVTFGNGNNLRLRGSNGWGTAKSTSDCSTITFGNETPVACSGDIRTLVDYMSYETTSTADARFCSFFLDCSQLTSAPALPATTLAEDCYQNMFSGCTSLATAPELPATTLTGFCYYEMFSDCTSLTTAPVLSATELVSHCYHCMFENCRNLNYVKAAFTTTPDSYYTHNWLYGVAPTGTFVKNPAATWDVTGANGVPEGWGCTVENPTSIKDLEEGVEL